MRNSVLVARSGGALPLAAGCEAKAAPPAPQVEADGSAPAHAGFLSSFPYPATVLPTWVPGSVPAGFQLDRIERFAPTDPPRPAPGAHPHVVSRTGWPLLAGGAGSPMGLEEGALFAPASQKGRIHRP